MIDRPDAEGLLSAMARVLTDEVLPATSGPAQHATRVVANLCRILEREQADAGRSAAASREALAALLGREGSLEELVAALDQRLRDADEAFDVQALTVLRADVGRRLAIDRPGYDA